MASMDDDVIKHDVTNRLSMISQRSIASVTSCCSQHGDSGIEFDHDISPSSVFLSSPEPTMSPLMTSSTEVTSSPEITSSASKTPVTPSHKKRFTFDASATHPHNGVMVPFLVLLVKDVYFLNQAISTVQPDGTINFEKLRRLSEILRPLESWKAMSSTYPKNEVLQSFLLHSPVLEDSDLYSISYKREAPTNRFEKQQIKTLKFAQEMKKRKENIAMKTLRRKTV
uniref:Ras-GEF domain-containing protein n=1 Tax=Ciona savignyi TaxID=51511 RepID=H2YGN7_CIOSA